MRTQKHRRYTSERGQGSVWNWVKEMVDREKARAGKREEEGEIRKKKGERGGTEEESKEGSSKEGVEEKDGRLHV